MASETYTISAIVLRKTKLAETDLIVTLLAADGRQVRAVAKGARKPTSPFAARLEVFAEVDVLLVRGKNLDIVKEARLVDAHLGVRGDMEHAAAATPMLDAVMRLTQPDLEAPRLFALTSSALAHVEQATSSVALALCAAHLLKAFAFSGFRPSFSHCASCGAPVVSQAVQGSAAGTPERGRAAFSPAEGGAVCSSCMVFVRTIPADVETLAWADWLMHATFDDVAAAEVPGRVSFDVLHLCQAWSEEHAGARLKSLEFLFTCGLF